MHWLYLFSCYFYLPILWLFCKLKGFVNKASIEKETKGGKQAAYEHAGDVIDKDD